MSARRGKVEHTAGPIDNLGRLCTVVIVLLVGVAPAGAQTPVRDYWPTERWRVELVSPDANFSSVAALVAYAFPDDRDDSAPEDPDDSARKGVRTDGLVVIRDGLLIYERYAAGYDEDMPHLAWSATKSFVHSLYGVAMQRGLIERDAMETPIPDGWLGREDWAEMTAEDLLWMASGLHFNEKYEGNPLDSSVTEMLYGGGTGDMARFAAGLPFRNADDDYCAHIEPGECFSYSSGDSNIAVARLRKLLGPEVEWATFPWDHLFNPIGMKTAVWEPDRAGNFVGSSYLYATPRDLARWGFLYLNKGVWNGDRLVPRDWVELAGIPNEAYVSTCGSEQGSTLKRCTNDPPYGVHWWTNRKAPDSDEDLFWPDLPADLFFAWGHWGQKVYVIPSLDMVIVRTADDRDDCFRDASFLSLALAAFAPERTRP